MSMYGRDPWGGALEINADSATDDDRSRNLQDFDRSALSRQLDETQQSWLLGPGEQKKKKYVDLGCIVCSRTVFKWIVISLLLSGSIAGLVTLIVKLVPRHRHSAPPPDDYTKALHKALMFFNAQRSGPLPKHNNVSWRGNSGMRDGLSDPGSNHANLVGGFYDAGDAIKFNFPAAFAMTMLSWSVIEYSAKYEAAGELNHAKDIIKWGADYFLKTFNSSADTISLIHAQILEAMAFHLEESQKRNKAKSTNARGILGSPKRNILLIPNEQNFEHFAPAADSSEKADSFKSVSLETMAPVIVNNSEGDYHISKQKDLCNHIESTKDVKHDDEDADVVRISGNNGTSNC